MSENGIFTDSHAIMFLTEFYSRLEDVIWIKSPRSDQMKIGTKEPRMTKRRAWLLSLMDSYLGPS